MFAVFLPHCPKELTNNLLYVNLRPTGTKSTAQSGQKIPNSLMDEICSDKINEKSSKPLDDVKPSREKDQKSSKSSGDTKSANPSLSRSGSSSEHSQTEKISSRTLVTNLVLISNSISSTLLRTPASEIAKCANIIQVAIN